MRVFLLVLILLALVGMRLAQRQGRKGLGGPLVVAVASGFYLGVRLGPGPRDGLMTAMARRGITLWKARFGVEAAALVAGYLMGGTVGGGTIWFLVIIGPAVQISLRFLSVPVAPGEASI